MSMQVARPAARTLARRPLAALPTPAAIVTSPTTCTTQPQSQPPHQQQRCSFHSSGRLQGRRKPRFSSVTAKSLGLVDDDSIGKFSNKHFPNLNQQHHKALQAKYTPEQYEAIRLGEEAVDPKDLTIQGRLRKDPFQFQYVEDFSKIRPVLDKKVPENKPVDSNSRFMTPDEFGDDFIKWATQEAFPPQSNAEQQKGDKARSKKLNGPEGENNGGGGHSVEIAQSTETRELSDLDAWKYLADRSSMTGFGDGGDSALAAELPTTLPGREGMIDETSAEDKAIDPEGIYGDTKKATRLPIRTIIEMEKSAKILLVRFVSNQTRLGKIRSSSIMALVGNGNGSIGIGVAKSVEGSLAMTKAKLRAIQNMMPIRRYENRTIFGNVEAKVGATVVKLYSRPPGFGLRVSHRIFEIMRAAGISDLSAKMPRSRNPMNSVKATVLALQSQADPEEIARGRGKKLVDARKVYYGGSVY